MRMKVLRTTKDETSTTKDETKDEAKDEASTTDDETSTTKDETSTTKDGLSSYEKITMEFILGICPELEAIFNSTVMTSDTFSSSPYFTGRTNGCPAKAHGKFLPLDKKRFLIHGETQSGKTKTIQAVCLYHNIFSKCSALVILPNATGGADQFKKRSAEFARQHSEYAASKNESGNSIKYIYAKTATPKQLKDAFNGTTQHMVIALSNSTQIDKVKRAIAACKKPKYIVVGDEADQLLCGSSDAKFRQMLKPIFTLAGRSYLVTATAFDLMFTQQEIATSTIINLRPTQGLYKGIDKVLKISVDDKNDEPLFKILEERCGRTDDKKSEQPDMMLIKIEREKTKHIALGKRIRDHPVIGAKWAVFIHNSDGIGTSAPGIPSSGKDGFTWSKMSVSSAIQRHKETYPNIPISIIAGICADRGMSYVDCQYDWHLTCMYYIPSKTEPVASMIQASGRLCGNYNDKDDVPLTLYAPHNVLIDIVKGIESQKEAIETAKETVGSLAEVMKNMSFDSEKIPKRKLGREKVARFAKATTLNPDSRSRDRYTEQLDKIKEMEGMKKPSSRRKTSGSYVDDGGIKRINPSLIIESSVLYKVHQDVIAILSELGTGKWISRSYVVREMLKDGGYEQGHQSRLKHLVEEKSEPVCPLSFAEGVKSPESLMFQKVEGIWNLRLD
jgi:hypothetical protein